MMSNSLRGEQGQASCPALLLCQLTSLELNETVCPLQHATPPAGMAAEGYADDCATSTYRIERAFNSPTSPLYMTTPTARVASA
jgi:hypothetical protein